MESRQQNREIVENPQVVLHNNHDIPPDIIYEILARLPVKTILRFKAVSKLWHSTISNAFFRRRCPATKSIFAMSKSNTKDFYLIDEEGGIERFRVPAWSRLEYKVTHLVISNSCNGLVLLRRGTAIFLFNPTTRYIDRVLTQDKYYDDIYTIELGFCYDESITDYKAVIFFWHSQIGDKSAIVATLKKKEWTARRIPTEFLSIKLGPLVNDRLHLMVDLSRSDRYPTIYNAIVSFNQIKDVFEKVACPQPKSGDEDKIVGLGVLEDCLCMTRGIGGGDVEVLKMKEYGVAESWTSLFVIKSQYHYRVEPLFPIKNGDIVLRGDLYMSRYNPAKKYTNLTECGTLLIPELLGAASFEENLFFPKSSSVVNKYRGDSYTRNACGCFNCGEAGHMARDCPSARRYGCRCFNCGKQGHFARDCRSIIFCTR